MKKLKFIFSVLLSLLIVFSVFPSTVYADYSNNLSFNYEFESSFGNIYNTTAKSGVSVTSDPIIIKNLESVGFLTGFNVSCERGDLVTINFKIDNTNVFGYRGQFGVNYDDTIFKAKFSDTGILSDGYNEFSCVLECLRGVTNYHFNLQGFITPISYNESVKDSYFTITCSGNYSVTDEKMGLLNSILEWLENIRDKIVNLPSEFGSFITDLKTNMSSWFTDLGNNIKNTFSELKNNLTEWFKNVGDWFSALGDSIGGFFTDLWDNISLKFESINIDVRNWWQSVKDWFHSLFVPEDGWFEEYQQRFIHFFDAHFGFIWQAVQLAFNLVNIIVDCFDMPANGKVIIPEISLPWNNYKLVDSTEFDFNTIINSNERFKWFYTMFRTVSSAVILLLVVNFSKKHFDEFLKDREVSE